MSTTAATSSSDPEPAPANRFAVSVDHLRSTAKWTLVAYAAVGGILIAGSQLSSIGAFEPGDHRLWLAVIAATVALSAVAAAVYFVVGVQTAGHVTLAGLVAQERAAPDGVHPLIRQDPALLSGYPSIEALRDDYLGFIADYYQLARIDDKPAEAAVAGAWAEYLGRVTDQLLASARYADVSASFSGRVRVWLLIASIAAAVAIGVFAWAANPSPATNDPAEFAMPAPGTLLLGPDELVRFGPLIGGASCVQASIPVIVLGLTDTAADIVIPQRFDCPVTRLTVPRELVVAAQAVPSDAPSAATRSASVKASASPTD